MNKETIEIRIDKTGGFTFEAKEGFAGQSCTEKTKDLEIALGGVIVDSEKTDDYYKDGDNPLNLNIY